MIAPKASVHARTDGMKRRPRETGKVIAVTGGAGFIGSHLCEELISGGHHVVCLDNFHTGRPENVDNLSVTNRFSLIEHDITNPIPVDLPRFDEIYNLACPASPVHYQENRVRTALVCALGALHVMERATQDGARVLQASTSEVYGDPDVHPQTEEYFGNVNTVGPRSCYDEGKRFAETIITDYGAQAGITTRIARIFNTYGPRMQADDGRVVSNFIVQALAGDEITIYGDGQQTRSFCYVDDLVRGLIRLMNYEGALAGPINLGNPAETTMGELATIVLELTGSESRCAFRPLPVDDPRRRRPNIEKAKEFLNWEPATQLRDGLLKAIGHFSAAEIGADSRQILRI